MFGIKYFYVFLVFLCSLSMSQACSENERREQVLLNETGTNVSSGQFANDEHKGPALSLNSPVNLKQEASGRINQNIDICFEENVCVVHDYLHDMCPVKESENDLHQSSSHLFCNQRGSDRSNKLSNEHTLFNNKHLFSSGNHTVKKNLNNVAEISDTVTSLVDSCSGLICNLSVNVNSSYSYFDDDILSEESKTGLPSSDIFFGPHEENVYNNGNVEQTYSSKRKTTFLNDCIISDVIPDRITEFTGLRNILPYLKESDITDKEDLLTNMTSKSMENKCHSKDKILKEVRQYMKPLKRLLRALFSKLESRDDQGCVIRNLFAINQMIENSLNEIKREITHIKNFLKSCNFKDYNEFSDFETLYSKQINFPSTK